MVTGRISALSVTRIADSRLKASKFKKLQSFRPRTKGYLRPGVPGRQTQRIKSLYLFQFWSDLRPGETRSVGTGKAELPYQLGRKGKGLGKTAGNRYSNSGGDGDRPRRQQRQRDRRRKFFEMKDLIAAMDSVKFSLSSELSL